MINDLNIEQIKKLRILDLVIQLGSLKKASLQAKVTASAISQTITSLEQSFGKPLLVRNRGSVTPTADALAILEVIRPAFTAFDRLRELGTNKAPKITWMNFGTYESIAIDLLPGLIQSLRQKLPDLKLGLRISRTANLLSMIRKGELCSALITETDELERFYVKEVATDRLGFYVSRNHSIAKEGWLAVEKFGVGSLSPGKEGLPRYFTKFMRQNGISKTSILSDSFESLRAAAAAGAIVSVLPNRVATRFDDLLEIRPLLGTKPPKDIGQHKILVVSQSNCDRQEADFVAEESQRILNLSHQI